MIGLRQLSLFNSIKTITNKSITNTNKNTNKSFNISNYNNSLTMTKTRTTEGSIQNISTVFTKVTVSFLEIFQINFLNILFLNLQVRSINSIIFQYTSYQEGIHYMLGKQVGVVVPETQDLNNYRNLFEHYREMLELLIDRYQLEGYQLEEPDFITFHFKTLQVDEDLKAMKYKLSKIELHKGLVKFEKIKTNFNSNILPYTYKERYFGYLLIGILREKYLSELVALLEKNKFSVGPRTKDKISFQINFETNENEWQKSFGSGIEFLQYVINKKDCKVFLHATRRYLIISRMDPNYKYQRSVFNLKTGQFLLLSFYILKLDEACKYLYNVNYEKLWIRKTSGTSLVFNENSNIQALVTHRPLEAIKYVEFKQKLYLEKRRKTPPQPLSNPNYSLGSVLIDNKEVTRDWNSYKKRTNFYNSKTNIWTETRPLDFYNLTRSIYVYVQKNIIKFSRPLDYDNLTRSISVYIPKKIIKFYTSTYPNPKVIFELCYANEQRLKDSLGYAYAHNNNNINNNNNYNNNNNNNINKKASLPSLLKYAMLFAPQRGWVLGWLRGMDGRYSATKLSIRSGSVLLRREEESNCSRNINSLNIFLLIGMVFSLYAPILIYKLTGVIIYNKYYAAVFFNLLFYFFVLNKNRLKLSILNKPMLWASTIIVKGGFEGLGDPDIEEQLVTPKPMRTFNSSQITDLGVELPLSLSATQNESKSKDSSATTRFNPEVNDVPVHLPPEGSNAKPSTERSTTSGYPLWPRPNPASNIPILPESNSEPAPTSHNNKKVRINEYTEVKEISELGLDNQKEKIYETIQLEPKNKLHRHRADERDKNIIDNSDLSNSTNSNTLNYFRGTKTKTKNKQKSIDWLPVFNWERAYPKKEAAEEENWPEIEVVNPILEEIKRYKSAGSLAGPNLDNINGQITNPSSTSKKDALSHLLDFKNK